MNEEEGRDEEYDWSNEGVPTHPPHLTSKQACRRKENDLRRMRHEIAEKKRLATLLRASIPHSKKIIVGETSEDFAAPPHPQTTRKRSREEIIQKPPVSVAHKDELRRLEAEVAAAREALAHDDEEYALKCLEVYKANYIQWESTMYQAIASVYLDLEREGVDGGGSSSASCATTTTPHQAKTSKGVPSHQPTLLTFFKPTENTFVSKVKQFYKDVYYERVEGNTAPTTIPWYGDIDDIKGEFEEFAEEVNQSTSKRRRQAAVSLVKEVEEEMCGDCGVQMIMDQKTHFLSCPGCGVVTKGKNMFQQSFAEQQSSSRTAAPYERIAHVS